MTGAAPAGPVRARIHGGQIRIERIRFDARIGFAASERAKPRPVEVDVTITTALTDAARSDDLRQTLDYRRVCDAVVEAATARPYKLLEAMAGAVLSRLAELVGDAPVEVTVWKPDPPLAGSPTRVGVTLGRGRT